MSAREIMLAYDPSFEEPAAPAEPAVPVGGGAQDDTKGVEPAVPFEEALKEFVSLRKNITGGAEKIVDVSILTFEPAASDDEEDIFDFAPDSSAPDNSTSDSSAPTQEFSVGGGDEKAHPPPQTSTAAPVQEKVSLGDHATVTAAPSQEKVSLGDSVAPVQEKVSLGDRAAVTVADEILVSLAETVTLA